MASTTVPLAVSPSSAATGLDGKQPGAHPQMTMSTQSVGVPCLTPPGPVAWRPPIHHGWKSMASYKTIARNMMAMATGGAAAAAPAVATTDVSDISKTILEAWDKREDKYAVTSLAAAGFVAIWGASGVISAIDRLPMVPGVLELVGMGYTGWFAYKNLLYKPDREALLQKIKATYNEIIGSG